MKQGNTDPIARERDEARAERDRLRRVNNEWELVMSALIDGLAERNVLMKLGGTYTQAALDEIDRLRSEIAERTAERDVARQEVDSLRASAKDADRTYEELTAHFNREYEAVVSLRTEVTKTANEIAAEAEPWDEPFRTGPFRWADRLRVLAAATPGGSDE